MLSMTRLCHLQPRAPAYSLHQPVLHRFPTGLSLCELPVKKKRKQKGKCNLYQKKSKACDFTGIFSPSEQISVMSAQIHTLQLHVLILYSQKE